jgi:hypothetical protein
VAGKAALFEKSAQKLLSFWNVPFGLARAKYPLQS